MKKTFLLTYAILVYAMSFAQSDATTFILVRHAEKESDGSKDPALTKAGQERSLLLMRTLDKQKVDLILSTNFLRTKNTVKPLADAKGIEVQTYESIKAPQFEELISKHKGGTIVVSGHSNTIPGFANLLLGTSQFANYDDADYGNILIVTVTSVGKGNVLHLRY